MAACNAAPILARAEVALSQSEPLLTRSIEQLASVHHEGVNGEETKYDSDELQTRTTRFKKVVGKLIDVDGAIDRAFDNYERSGPFSNYVAGPSSSNAHGSTHNSLGSQRALDSNENLSDYNLLDVFGQERFKHDYNLKGLLDHPAYVFQWQQQYRQKLLQKGQNEQNEKDKKYEHAMKLLEEQRRMFGL